jgi:hypothetical protein
MQVIWWGKFWAHFVLGELVEFHEPADKLTDLIPENAYAWNIKGWSHFILGKVEKSLRCYENVQQRYYHSHRQAMVLHLRHH